MSIKKTRIGDKIFETTQRKSQKHPVIGGAVGKQIDRGNGRVDCTVSVPCIQVVSEQKKVDCESGCNVNVSCVQSTSKQHPVN